MMVSNTGIQVFPTRQFYSSAYNISLLRYFSFTTRSLLSDSDSLCYVFTIAGVHTHSLRTPVYNDGICLGMLAYIEFIIMSYLSCFTIILYASSGVMS